MLVLLPSLLGWQRYAIVSGSMTGTYDRGSLVLDEVVPVGELQVGDVITYTPPAGDHLITHRIAWIGRDPSGARAYRTKGDANPVADPWTFRLDRPTQAPVRAFSRSADRTAIRERTASPARSAPRNGACHQCGCRSAWNR